jgi:hypothetical protein
MLQQSASCKDVEGSLTCSLDQDAGQLSIKPAEGGMLVSPIQDIRADAESADEAEYTTVQKSNPEDRVFMLRAVEASDCKEFDTED